MLSKKKDFIGRGMAARPALTDPSRPTLVGLRPVKQGDIIRAGAHLLPQGVANTAEHDQGWVTSAVYSDSFQGWIALGMLANGPARLGELVRAVDLLRGHDVLVQVCEPVFYDPAGERLRV